MRPPNVMSALTEVADWLDEADRLIDRLAEARGIVRRNSGDDVQRDLRMLAIWFADHPESAADAWATVQKLTDR